MNKATEYLNELISNKHYAKDSEIKDVLMLIRDNRMSCLTKYIHNDMELTNNKHYPCSTRKKIHDELQAGELYKEYIENDD